MVIVEMRFHYLPALQQEDQAYSQLLKVPCLLDLELEYEWPTILKGWKNEEKVNV